MSPTSLADRFEGRNPVELLRQEQGAKAFPIPQDVLSEMTEYTHWIEEQRSWRETCGMTDFSHHMVDFHVEGPDAVALHADNSVNNYEDFEVGTAKQIVVTNPNGYQIGDAILLRLGENELMSTGVPMVANWLQFHHETGDYDVEVERFGRTHEVEGNPEFFRYQLMGPETDNVVDEVTEDPLPEIPFFNFREVTIDGHDMYALRHTMTGRGLELWGDYEHGPALWDHILDAGEEYGIRELGTRAAFGNISVVSGWFPLPVPAVYEHEDLQEFREWLPEDSIEAICPLGGSFKSEDITDYYVTPVEVGYGRVVSLDHDFVGRDALAGEVENPDRKPVTLVWDPEDVIDVYASLFRGGETNKYIDMPLGAWDSAHYDTVLKDGEQVGLSMWYGYTYNEREMLSEAVVDVEHAEPGTEVTVVWGEENSPKTNVERHVETEIDATVAEMPYSEDNRDYY
ncbi:MAG: aminomethyl transferase family protein [Haloarculaceae archaeon]